MSDILHHLVRRGIDATNHHFAQIQPLDGEAEPDIKHIALWGMILLWATTILYFLMASAMNYTYGEVVGTLTMIESPIATAFTTTVEEESTEVDAPLLSEDQKSEKQHLKALAEDLFIVKQPPITAKIRSAMKHLRSVAGPFARFRGLHVALIYHILHGLIVGLVAPHRGLSLFRPIVSVIATVGLCRIQMVWTHIVISQPTTKAWYRRFPSFKAAKNIVVPTAIFALSQQAAMYIPARLVKSITAQIGNPQAYGINPQSMHKIILVELIFVALVAISTVVCIIIPADVTLTRVQASMLPEEDETIVPFDRTFAGKVKPEILGGSGSIGMLDAWKTFDKGGRIRVIKLYAKLFVIQVATVVLFGMAIVAELRLIMGDDFNKMLKAAKDQLKH